MKRKKNWVFRWLGRFPAHDQDFSIRILAQKGIFSRLEQDLSAEHVSKSQGKCETMRRERGRFGRFLFIVDYLVPKKRSPCFDNFSIFQTIFVFSTLLSPCFHFFCSPFLFRFLDNISTHTQTHYTHTHIIHCHYIKKNFGMCT